MLQQDALSWAKALNLCFFYPFSAQFCARCLQFFGSVIQKNASSSSKARGGNSFFFFTLLCWYRNALSTQLCG